MSLCAFDIIILESCCETVKSRYDYVIWKEKGKEKKKKRKKKERKNHLLVFLAWQLPSRKVVWVLCILGIGGLSPLGLDNTHGTA